MVYSKKGPDNPARPKRLLKLSLVTVFLCVSSFAFSQTPPGPPPGGPPPPPNPLNLFKKHKKDTTKKSDNANVGAPPAVATPPPGGPPPPPNPFKLFKRKKKDTTRNSKN